jgi:hypothetical protein
MTHRCSCHEVEGCSLAPKAATPADAMKVGLKVGDAATPLHGDVIVDHQCHLQCRSANTHTHTHSTHGTQLLVTVLLQLAAVLRGNNTLQCTRRHEGYNKGATARDVVMEMKVRSSVAEMYPCQSLGGPTAAAVAF